MINVMGAINLINYLLVKKFIEGQIFINLKLEFQDLQYRKWNQE